jgi:predicted O-methyltransferase YrrM
VASAIRLARRLAAFAALRRSARLPEPPPGLLERLSVAWGNQSFAAGPEYLAAVWREAAVLRGGNVLECGCGLSTLVLAALGRKRRLTIWSLEHDEEWAARTRRALRLAAVGSRARLRACELRSYGEYDWYALPEDLPDRFALVVCDGPPGDTRGGRVGLLPVAGDRLQPGCRVLLDDAAREGEQAVLREWARTYGAIAAVEGRDKPLAMIAVPRRNAGERQVPETGERAP